MKSRSGVFNSISAAILVLVLLVAVFGQPAEALTNGLANDAKRDIETGENGVEYNRDVRPILTDNCFACHGPDSASRAADLRLDQREAAIDYGAISPGSLDDSSVWQRIVSEDEDEMMPPPTSHKTLTSGQKQILRQWILDGAEYEPHWAFIPAVLPVVPEVSEERWNQNPIDRFVWTAMQKQGLQPAAEADRNTLARRVSLDVTGLPPSPQLVQEFVNDPSPDAYEKLVDRLLESPQWGEHRGRYWLDVARYADTHGIHFDNYREMWSYRDWVIDAFNQNMPFDEFTIQQLAGDLLPEPDLDQQIATGFNRCNITTNEGGIIDEEYKVLYARDRTETTALTWMGLTVGCAVCHDHKFDPFSQKEFYELSAFFNNTTQAVRDGNIKDTPPTVFVPARADRTDWNQVQADLQQVRASIQQRKSESVAAFDQWLANEADVAALPPLRSEGLHLSVGVETSTAAIPMLIDGKRQEVEYQLPTVDPEFPNAIVEAGQKISLPNAGDFESTEAFSFGGWIRFEGNNNNGSLFARMDEGNNFRGWDLWCEGGRIATHLVNSWPNNALKVVTQQPIPSGKWTHVFVSYDGSKKAGGVRIFIDGQPAATNVATDRLSETIRTETPFNLFQRSMGSRVLASRLSDVRLYRGLLSDSEVRSLATRKRLLESLTALKSEAGNSATDAAQQEVRRQQRDLVYQWYLDHKDAEYQNLNARLATLTNRENLLRSRGTKAHVMHEASSQPKAFVLNRGEYDQRRDEVTSGTPEMLPAFGDDLERNRMGLAKWLLRDEHPLTARVTVNRFWQSIFGRGIVATSGDFGLTGTPPSHPELLDWLAVDFRENGWDVKRFFKQILMSQTYRQSAKATAEKLEKDPDNVWLSHGPRFRMDAEMVRDYGLAVSGLLVKEIGGPSVRPYQPPGVWEAVAMPESNTRNYKRDSGESLYRRSMYTFWKRSAPPASMDIFNAPSREVCTIVRERTNTPLQALATLNDPQLIEAARVLACRLLEERVTWASDKPSNVASLNWLSQRILARSLEPQEVTILESVLQRLESHYQANPEDVDALLAVGESPVPEGLAVTEVAVWTMVANQLMNLDETLCK